LLSRIRTERWAEHASNIADDIKHASSIADDVKHASSIADDVKHASNIADDIKCVTRNFARMCNLEFCVEA
jgi:hypothetical protein